MSLFDDLPIGKVASFAGLTGGPQQLPYTQNQAQLIQQLQARMNGQSPSLALEQSKVNQQQVLANTMGAIHSAPGLNSALQARLGTQAGQKAQTDFAQQGMLGDLAERNTAAQILGGQITAGNNMAYTQYNDQLNRRNQMLSGLGQAAVQGGMGGA